MSQSPSVPSTSGESSVSLRVNGRTLSVASPPDTPLLWVLRGELQQTGPKFGCGIAVCGACTVLLNGAPIRSCVTPLSAVGTNEVTTIDGLNGPEAAALSAAWAQVDVVQCGYCQPGQMVSACALLRATPTVTDADIDRAMAGNLCRCGTYPRIREAIHQASATLGTPSGPR